MLAPGAEGSYTADSPGGAGGARPVSVWANLQSPPAQRGLSPRKSSRRGVDGGEAGGEAVGEGLRVVPGAKDPEPGMGAFSSPITPLASAHLSSFGSEKS